MRKKIDFGGVATDGAFRIVAAKDGFVLTPLPGSLPFSATIDPKAFGLSGGVIAFDCDAAQFDYRIPLDKHK